MMNNDNSSSNSNNTCFEVRVSKESFKFNAAHFVAFPNFRERIHGHNYQVAVRLVGSRTIGTDGYVVDFGDIKAVTKRVCKGLNEHFLCPTLSDVMDITIEKTSESSHGNNSSGSSQRETVKLVCEDGSIFVFPRQDCAMLPLVHATTEELAIYLWGKILSGLDASFLKKRGIHTMEVTVAEAIGQEAAFRYEIPETTTGESSFSLDVRTFIERGEIVPSPCLEVPTSTTTTTTDSKKTKECDGSCQASKAMFSAKLQRLADSINSGGAGLLVQTAAENQCQVTVEDLEKMML